MSGPDSRAITRHRDLVRELSRPDGPLSARGPNATVNNPAWFRTLTQPRGARGELHDALIAACRAMFPDARADKRAIVLAGPPGAGKSTVQRAILRDRAPDWLVVDADEFKHALLGTAIEDGSYQDFLMPDVVRELEAAGERFAPLELASLVHEESSLLARQLRADAIADELNIVVDTVLSSESGAREVGAQLQQAGYEVSVVDVETTYAISAARVEQRWRDVTRQFLADERNTGSAAGGCRASTPAGCSRRTSAAGRCARAWRARSRRSTAWSLDSRCIASTTQQPLRGCSSHSNASRQAAPSSTPTRRWLRAWRRSSVPAHRSETAARASSDDVSALRRTYRSGILEQELRDRGQGENAPDPGRTARSRTNAWWARPQGSLPSLRSIGSKHRCGHGDGEECQSRDGDKDAGGCLSGKPEHCCRPDQSRGLGDGGESARRSTTPYEHDGGGCDCQRPATRSGHEPGSGCSCGQA